MSDQSVISRREALIAATVITVIGASVADAGDKTDGQKTPATLKLNVTLSDGQTITLSAVELVIDFGGEGQLLVKQSGVMPVSKPFHASGKNELVPTLDRPFEAPRQK